MNYKKVLYLLSIYFSMSFESAFSQGKISFSEKIERKVSFSPYIGIMFFPSDLKFNNDFISLQKNIFQDFAPAPLLGCMVQYKLKKRILLGLDGSFFLTSRTLVDKKISGMNGFSLATTAKITMLNSSKSRFSPFFVVGFGATFINYLQNSSEIKQIDSPETPINSEFGGTGVEVSQIDQKFEQIKLTMAPMFGPQGGIGLDVKINKKISFFVQGTIHTTFGNGQLYKEYFKENGNNPLTYVAFKAGVSVRLFKKMKFEVDSEAVRIPDPIIALVPLEDNNQPAQMLSRESNFVVNIREGTKHNVEVMAQNGEINIDIDQNENGNPCPILAVLYDQFGQKVASVKPDKDGKVNFKGLDQSAFNVAFELQPPCKEADFTYAVNEGEIKSQNNSKSEIPNDSLSYNIDGFVDFKNPTMNKENVQVMLVDQKDKKVAARQSTKSNGSFAFMNLKPGNYKVVYDVGNPRIQSRVSYEIKTNRDSLIERQNFPFNELKDKSKESTRLMAGKLELANASFAAYKVNLELVDKYNRIIDHSIPNKDGSFEFIDRESDHNDIIYNVSDKKLDTKQMEIKSIVYEPKSELSKKLAEIANNKSNNAENLVPSSKPIYSGSYQSDLHINTIYDANGIAKTISGFGFQVGSFRNLAYVQQMMKKLKSQGYEVYMQPVESGNSASRFKTSQSYVFNRVIVFGGKDADESDAVKSRLQNDSYEIIVKEKFSTVVKDK